MSAPQPTPVLDRALVHGLAWTGAMKWLTQLLSWAITLIVARLLAPADYGLVGMAMVYFGLAQLLGDVGLPSVVLRQRDLTERQLARLGGLALMVGVTLTALTVGLSGLIAWFFGEPEVRWILTALSVTFLAKSVQMLPRALLARDLRFRSLAWIDGLEALTQMLSTLLLAALGLRFWALVGGQIASTAASALLCARAQPHRFELPRSLESIADAVTFGRRILASQIAWYAYSNADFAIVGRVLGKVALGGYTVAWTIASIPVDRISAMVGRVTPAFFAAVQRDPPALRRYLGGLTEVLGLVTLPVCVGLVLVAGEFVPVVLGPAWASVVAPLRLLALYAAVRSLITLTPQVLVAVGDARRNMQFSLLAALVLPVVFVVGSHWGTAGVALGWVTVYPALAGVTFVRTALRAIDMRWRDYLRALWPGISATAAMTVAVLALEAVASPQWTHSLRLALEVAVGAVTYLAIVGTAHRTRVDLLLNVLRGGGPESPTPVAHPTPRRIDAPRLLLVSYHFPPDPAVGARRWGQLARYAAERGWGLDVIALDSEELPARDPEGFADLPLDVRVFGVSLPKLGIERLEAVCWRVYRALRDRWHARRAVTGNGNDAVPLPPQRAGSLPREEMRWRPLRPRTLARAYFAWLEYARSGAWARAAARLGITLIRRGGGQHRAMITCGPPHMAHAAGRLVAEVTGLPFVMDLRDPWSLVQRLPEDLASPVWLRLAERHERQAIAHASLLVANTEPHAEALRVCYPRSAGRVIAVSNGFDAGPLPLSPNGNQRFVVAYAGSLYLDRDPRPLFRAAARMVQTLDLEPADFGIDLMGEVASFDGLPLATIARVEGLDGFVRTLPPGTRANAHRFLAQAALLVLLPQDSDLAIPAKTFEYMQFNAWLLALAAPRSAVARLLEGSRADVVAPDDVDAIAGVLVRHYQEHARGERGVPLALDPRFSRQAQANRLFGALEAITGAPARRPPKPQQALDEERGRIAPTPDFLPVPPRPPRQEIAQRREA
jgi:PST family polysaccharide transporter